MRIIIYRIRMRY